MNDEKENSMGRISSFPIAVKEPRWSLHIVLKKCRAEGVKFCEIAHIVTEEGTFNHCCKERRLEQGEAKSELCAVEGDDRA